ncbi:MAG: hypothetical protein COW01_06180 [Bdellovibrionales bacterium CG12_big_fil_rev_8_21_14_0_65_38_15]|nr:MAG: hypothetical protein COW79_04075 [Bdellovibrionales bacterium CG22_combo_CG10-13_8_21_14_all_38_13]PIQ56015.1 MAG: hypothetical protein COW01_06180 [Bdellovibrionales bacterium CG12_big_fil_rev_8_21_14_0_65_38_15]PIR30620.1 MAG: hypothetical protein COV38_04720 [Bdellovibrionales bacterium CG11_big_fil_rev_8_21_14_0_20_38_13]
MDKDKIIKSKTFCMLPWVHMHLWPNGNTFPCCIWDAEKPLGRFGENSSLKDSWNSEAMKTLRKNMLNGKKSDGCKRCYELEEHGTVETLRKMSIDKYSKNWDFVEETKQDGTVDTVRMNYLDIRFNNLCNLKCQTCGPELSSSWYEDQTKMYSDWNKPKVIAIDANEKLWNELEPLLKNVENAYFAGGEPLICDEHYKILELWLENNMENIHINYTTNFALLEHKGAKVLDYWKKFKNVSVSASLDDSGSRAEYLRKGTKWDVIEKNRKMMIKECPNVTFDITPTISAYNVFHFPDFHLDWIEKKLLEPNALRLNILTYQEFMSVRIFPKAAKSMITEKYKKYRDKICNIAIKNGHYYFNVENGYNSVINFMNAQDDSHMRENFYERVYRVDSIRGERLIDVYPELKLLRYDF